MWKVKYLNWSHKIKILKIQAFTEKQAEQTASNLSDVKCILDIKKEDTAHGKRRSVYSLGF